MAVFVVLLIVRTLTIVINSFQFWILKTRIDIYQFPVTKGVEFFILRHLCVADLLTGFVTFVTSRALSRDRVKETSIHLKPFLNMLWKKQPSKLLTGPRKGGFAPLVVLGISHSERASL